MPLRSHGDSFVAHFFWTYPRRTAAMIGLLVLAGLAEGAGLLTLLPLLELTAGAESPSGLAQWVSDALRSTGLEPTLGPLLGVILVAMTAKGVFLWFAMRQVGYTVAQVSAELRRRLVRALMRAQYRFFRERPAGHVINAASSEARRASWAYKDACSAFADAVQGLIYVAVILLVSWQIALLAPLVGGALWLVLQGLVRMSRRAGAQRTQAMQRLVARLTALLPNIKPIKAMGREHDLSSLIEDDIGAYKRAERHSVVAIETMTAFREPLIVLTMVVGLYAALTYGSLSFSVVLALSILFYRLLMIIGRVQHNYQAMAQGESAFWSLYAQVEAAEAAREPQHDASHRQPPPSLHEGITFEAVHFGYEPGQPVLQGVSLTIPAGNLVTLTGPSGAGKTTLTDLVTGLLTPQAGTIRIDGVPLADLDLHAWRRCIGYVPQELLLFHGTVAYNVALGNPQCTHDDIERALKAAGAWPFVEAHPEGVERLIGERGTKLSGGQGQRLMLARALVHRPRLLILDEATTGLDPATEAAVCETLLGLRGDLTIIAISHQLALQQAADLLVEVREGQVRSRPAASLVP